MGVGVGVWVGVHRCRCVCLSRWARIDVLVGMCVSWVYVLILTIITTIMHQLIIVIVELIPKFYSKINKIEYSLYR